MTLTVATWLWDQPGGDTAYHPDHVNTWAAMVRRNLDMDHRLVCITDHDTGFDPHIELVPLPRDPRLNFDSAEWPRAKPQCWRRIALFSPEAEEWLGPRFVSMDLDCIIGGPLDPVFNRPEDLVLTPGSYWWRLYNGSMLLHTAGSRRYVYDRFTPERAAKACQKWMGSDQAWLQYILSHHEARWYSSDGVRFWSARYRGTPDDRVIFTLGSKKPWNVCALDPWVSRHYRYYSGPS